MRHTYRHTIVLIAGIVIITILWNSPAQSARDVSSTQSVLPGARAIIDAIAYPSLQAALDALPDEGGVVHLPPGVFEINQPLIIARSDVLLKGAGTATHIKNVNTNGEPALILRHPDGGKNRKSSLWRICLTDFRLTGNEKSGPGIYARRINEIFIDGLTVSYHGGDGITLDFCIEDPRVCNSLITYNKATGLNIIGCHDIVVSANHFEENQDALRCIDAFNLCMTGNNIDDHLGNGVVIENTYGSVVSGNMIEDGKGAAVILERDCYGITLSANVIAHDAEGGILLRDAHGCTVSANTFTIMGNDALYIGPKSGRITVTGNNFSDSYVGDVKKVVRRVGDRAAGGMVLEGTTDITIVGNLFSSVRPKALSLKGKPSRRVIFSNNVLTDVESDHRKLVDSLVKDNLEPEKK